MSLLSSNYTGSQVEQQCGEWFAIVYIHWSISKTVPTALKFSPLKFESNGKGDAATGKDIQNPCCTCLTVVQPPLHLTCQPKAEQNLKVSWKGSCSLGFEAHRPFICWLRPASKTFIFFAILFAIAKSYSNPCACQKIMDTETVLDSCTETYPVLKRKQILTYEL